MVKLVRGIGWVGVLLSIGILLQGNEPYSVWEAVVTFGAAGILISLPREYAFTLRHGFGLALLFDGLYLYYQRVEGPSAIGASLLLVAGAYLADLLHSGAHYDAADPFPVGDDGDSD